MAKHLPQLKSSLPSIQEGLNKRQITALSNELVETVLEEGNAIQVAEAMAAMEEFVQRVRKDERFVDFLRDELLKHNGRMLTASGAKIEVCEAGVSYDYSQDPGWSSVDAQLKELTQQKKAIEETLRKLAPGRMAVDPETGEVLEGPTKKSKSTYRITLAKS